jgi:type IV pilus assembly protein PilM
MRGFLKSYLSFIQRFIPTKVEGNSVGLDLGAKTCKLLEIKKTDKGFELVQWSEEKVAENLSTTVSNLVSSCQEPPESVYTSIFGKGTLIRYIKMPRMSLDDLRGTFSIEADKYFPFPQEQIYTDCYILNPQDKSKEMTVLAAAAKRELIDQRIQILNSAGVTPELIGINAIALANIINTLGIEGVEKDQTIAILDIGDSVSNLSILRNNIPCFTRDIYLGGRDFTKRITNMLGIESDVADEIKKTPGDKKEEIVAACESLLMNLMQELRLSFDYFSAENNTPVTRLLLIGGGSRFPSMSSFFAEHLEVEAEYWNPLTALTIDENINKEELDQKAHQLGVALGLALYNYD